MQHLQFSQQYIKKMLTLTSINNIQDHLFLSIKLRCSINMDFWRYIFNLNAPQRIFEVHNLGNLCMYVSISRMFFITCLAFNINKHTIKMHRSAKSLGVCQSSVQSVLAWHDYCCGTTTQKSINEYCNKTARTTLSIICQAIYITLKPGL